MDTYNTGKQGKPKRCIELGAGVGLVGLTLASLSFDVVMTDIPFVLQSVLLPNIRRSKPLFAPCPASDDPSSAPTPSSDRPTQGGSVVGRELDWTVDPADWNWVENPSSVTSQWVDPSSVTSVGTCSTRFSPAPAGPPFDLILTTDTIYLPSLLPHLLKTLKTLSSLSGHPPILLALERRDPALVDRSLDEFLNAGFEAKMVNKGRLKKSVDRHLGWAKSDWDGVEVWKFRYKKLE
ncbi:Nicotinamide N-methyltransferase-like [Phaffia rhodozyma]|uniref:Nicotinamide N-methyltransferase-like n=1 Tax=Phaffia rhodozyma TaxID=264483 RepID=A0A0F7SJH9_PHARH|nr:Nicotinamide N-methyltransferase-like [Phaffia rhodozyma]